MIKSTEIRHTGEANAEKYKSLFKKLKRVEGAVIDEAASRLDKQAFEKIDCRTCANCCKTTGPLLIQQDINRLSAHFKMDAGTFIKENLEMDEDGDFILKSKPCQFLQADDLCSIYEIRPRACREYPHTDRKDFRDLESIHLANALICPAVQSVLDDMADLESKGALDAK